MARTLRKSRRDEEGLVLRTSSSNVRTGVAAPRRRLHETVRYDFEPFEEDRIRLHEEPDRIAGWGGGVHGRPDGLVPEMLDGDGVGTDCDLAQPEASVLVGEESPIRLGERNEGANERCPGSSIDDPTPTTSPDFVEESSCAADREHRQWREWPRRCRPTTAVRQCDRRLSGAQPVTRITGHLPTPRSGMARGEFVPPVP